MQQLEGQTLYSASDLNNFLECEHLVYLERDALLGKRTRPEQDPLTNLIASKGEEHEARYLERLRKETVVCEIPRDPTGGIAGLRASEQATRDAIESGAPCIYQATFFDGTFLGHADFLRRIDVPAGGRAWSYEVIDTKLALSTKPYFLIQLCNYSEHLARLQGSAPRLMHVVLGSGIENHFLYEDYAAYYRHVKATFLNRMSSVTNGTYPYEVKHCEICRWKKVCDAQRNSDDHLSLVANIRRSQIRNLESDGIVTLAGLADARDDQRPTSVRPNTFERLRAQATLQHQQRKAFSNGASGQRYFYELLQPEAGRGFELLPKPEPHDVFFDMEGDPLYAPEHGLEYLFGLYLPSEDRYVRYWARGSAEEQRAFEDLIDFLVAWREKHPQMHVYHYAPYETTALKRLMGRYATREDELDTLLRSRAFVDLYAVVRQSLRTSQPGYSIKYLEAFYDFRRETRVQRGDDSILMFETWLVSHDDAVLTDIENYNRDDCVSTYRLREWLLGRRAELIARGTGLDWRPEPQPPDETAAKAGAPEHARLSQRLLDGLVPPQSQAELQTFDDASRARWLLGHLLDYHRRDEKPAWWEYYHRCENRDELIDFDRKAIGGLRLCTDVPPYRLTPKQNPIYTYEFPEQDHDLGTRPYALNAAKPRSAGDLIAIDPDDNRLQLKVSREVDPASLDALAPGPPPRSDALRASLERIAEEFLAGALESNRPAILDLLLRRPPRLAGWGASEPVQPEHVSQPTVSRVVQALDRSYLFVQGPPGSGKSTIGAGIIVDLLAQGKKVAVMANAHKAIHNLVDKVETNAQERGVSFVGLQKYSSDEQRYESKLSKPLVNAVEKNEEFHQPHDLAAGTAWLFSRPELADRYDYLFIDEAGQCSLANAIACAPCAQNIVLLGDPLQLAQVSQGSHPIGVDLSVLKHLLGDDATIPKDRGVFLDVSYRMHPQICDFISHAVYAGRLKADPETVGNLIDSPHLSGSGLRFMPVAHFGNGRDSREEAQAVAEMFDNLVRGTYDRGGGAVGLPLEPSDILIVTPYNAQRKRIAATLAERGHERFRVGTVDKFQGQEAPVVIYSMATSSDEDMPRDMRFLFERNRFNVALSRAQCMTILVCSPRLLDVRCKHAEQMALVNLLCAFAEQATL